jgi:FAD/FMN-containing dehydrogenase
MVPLDLAAKGSCHIGGNISTNAGGLRLLRYGSLHENALGLEVVLADGTVLDSMSKMRKNNTGYDIKQLFVGSEGTLGVVTRVALLCPTRPKSINVALFGCESFPDLLNLYTRARRDLAEIVSSCEFFDDVSYSLVHRYKGVRCPITESPFYFLLETSGSSEQHDTEKLDRFLESVTSGEGMKGVTDGTVATDRTKVKDLWKLREGISESLLHDGYVYKYDVSIPLRNYYELVTVMRDHLTSKGVKIKSVAGFGHLGDSNLHFNVTSEQFDHQVLDAIEPYLYERVLALRGSVSAEHGLGFKKRDFIGYSRSDAAILVMAQLKRTLDPKGILNPYKVLPDRISTKIL